MDTEAAQHLAPQYLTPEQVCEIVPGLTKQGLAQARYLGTGPKYLRPTPRKILYRLADVIDWVEGTERISTAQAV